MHLKFIFAIALLIYSLDLLGSEIPFNEAINESHFNQTRLASVVRNHALSAKRKTLEVRAAYTAISLEGSVIKIY